jgi:hypothetical protein
VFPGKLSRENISRHILAITITESPNSPSHNPQAGCSPPPRSFLLPWFLVRCLGFGVGVGGGCGRVCACVCVCSSWWWWWGLGALALQRLATGNINRAAPGSPHALAKKHTHTHTHTHTKAKARRCAYSPFAVSSFTDVGLEPSSTGSSFPATRVLTGAEPGDDGRSFPSQPPRRR